MDDRDLMNMLRHAFLYGVNEGPGFDPDQRDKDLQELLDDCKKEGGCSYNSFCGSNCPEDCDILGDIEP